MGWDPYYRLSWYLAQYSKENADISPSPGCYLYFSPVDCKSEVPMSFWTHGLFSCPPGACWSLQTLVGEARKNILTDHKAKLPRQNMMKGKPHHFFNIHINNFS